MGQRGRLFAASGRVHFGDIGTRDTRALGIAGVTALRPRLELGARAYVFAHLGLGLTFSHAPFPIRGTRHNFTYEWGLGVAVGVTPRRFLAAGVRLAHISNGKGLDETINPSDDGVVIFVEGLLRPAAASGPPGSSRH